MSHWRNRAQTSLQLHFKKVREDVYMLESLECALSSWAVGRRIIMGIPVWIDAGSMLQHFIAVTTCTKFFSEKTTSCCLILRARREKDPLTLLIPLVWKTVSISVYRYLYSTHQIIKQLRNRAAYFSWKLSLYCYQNHDLPGLYFTCSLLSVCLEISLKIYMHASVAILTGKGFYFSI